VHASLLFINGISSLRRFKASQKIPSDNPQESVPPLRYHGRRSIQDLITAQACFIGHIWKTSVLSVSYFPWEGDILRAKSCCSRSHHQRNGGKACTSYLVGYYPGLISCMIGSTGDEGGRPSHAIPNKTSRRHNVRSGSCLSIPIKMDFSPDSSLSLSPYRIFNFLIHLHSFFSFQFCELSLLPSHLHIFHRRQVHIHSNLHSIFES
jgi:hypothetical protein